MHTDPLTKGKVPDMRNLKNVRKSQGLTLEQLAGMTGASAATICRYERGRRSPRVAQLLKIAAALDVPPGALLDDPPPSPRRKNRSPERTPDAR